MTGDLLKLTHFDSDVRFFHEVDERAFFEWLERVPCVESFQGEGPDQLVVRLRHSPREDDLRQLLALLFRYHANMTQLAKFETEENRGWFRRPDNFWHDAVFGGADNG
jgi:hypothetical protein